MRWEVILPWLLLSLASPAQIIIIPQQEIIQDDIEVWLDPIAVVRAKTSMGDLTVDVWTVRVCNQTAIYRTMFRERILSKLTFSTLPDSMAQTVLLRGAPDAAPLQRVVNVLQILLKRKPQCTCIYYGNFLPERVVLEPYSCGASNWIVTSPVVPHPQRVHYTFDRPEDTPD